jgi:ABC-type siderophore export system fused ATPase/permease subunit
MDFFVVGRSLSLIFLAGQVLAVVPQVPPVRRAQVAQPVRLVRLVRLAREEHPEVLRQLGFFRK